MNNALLYLGGLLVMALAVLFAVPYFVDWNSYRGVFEEEASRILGREVRVGGSVNLRLLPAPYVKFEKLRIADAGGDGGTSIFRADSFTMWLSVPPLLRGVLEANEVELKRPVLQLGIDATGAGNWREFSINPGLFPLLPTDVALRSVNLIDGVVAVSGPNKAELARLEKINGELVAEALEGPFKFKGTLNWGGGQRGVRLTTARQDPSGDIRFKAAVEAIDSANSYLLDGRVSDLKGLPRIDGELSAKLALGLGARGPVEATGVESVVTPGPEAPSPALSQAPSPGPPGLPGPPGAPEGMVAGAPSAAAPRAAGDKPQFDFRAKLIGDTSGFKLNDIAVALEQEGPPQLITGSATLAWAERLHLDVALASRWLDLDRLVGGVDGAPPLEAARALFEALATALPAEADTNATLEFDQLNLGGEAVSNVRLGASRANGPLELKGLRASLPGGTRLDLDGVLVLKAGEKMPRLDGTLSIAGQSLLRFLGWGFREKAIGEGRTDGPFALDGRFALGETAIELSEATAELAGMPLVGEVKLGLGARKKLTVALEGSKVDVGQIRSGILGLGAIETLVNGEEAHTPEEAQTPEGSRQAGTARGSRFIDLESTDLALKVTAAEIVDGARVLRDVEAQIAVERGTLSMLALKFITPEGLAVDVEGEATDVPAHPKGAIRGLIVAPTAEATAAFIRLLDLPADRQPAAERYATLAPFRVAGAFTFGAGAGTAAELSLDGTMQDGRVRATIRIDGGRSNWRSEPVDIRASVDSPNMEGLLKAAFASPIKLDTTAAPRPGRLVVKASGTPASGVLALTAITAEDFSLDYTGRLIVPATGPADVAGDLRIAAGDARAALGLAGLRLGEGAAGVPLSGAVALRLKDGVLQLTSEDLAVGGSKVRGLATLAGPEGQPRALTADLSVDSASFAGLMAPILARSNPAAPDAPDAPAAPAAPAVPAAAPLPTKGATARAPAPVPASADDALVWSERPFDLTPLNGLQGRVTARFGALALEPGLALSDARLEAVLGEGGIKIEKLEGGALGGKLTSSLNIDKAAAGIGLSGSLSIDISSAAPGDVAALALEFSGRALSPSAMISDLKGRGEIAVGDATLTGMTPAGVAAIAEAAVAGKGPTGGDALLQAVRGSLKEGQLKLGKLAIPVEISDGAMKLDKVKLETEAGRSTFSTAIELTSMKIDSEWQIEPRIVRATASGERVLLPAVSVVYVGKLRDLASLEPMVSTGALERELAVRKLERDIDELERLRKLDQTRSRQELERQKALETERAKQGAAPPGAGPPGASSSTQAPPGLETPGGAAAGAAAPAPGESTAPQAANGTEPAAASVPADDKAASAASVGDASAPQPAPADNSSGQVPRRRKPTEDAWRPFQATPY